MTISKSFKEYWSNFVWKKEHLLNKFVMFSSAIVIVLPLSFFFFFFLKNQQEGCVYGENKFIYIKIVWNNSGSFGSFKNNLVAIYLIQSLITITIFIVTIFVHKKTFLLFLYIVFLGGLFNLIQRPFTNNAVLDYFCFGFWPNFPVFNMPDTMVVIGTFGLMINILISTLFSKNNVENANK